MTASITVPRQTASEFVVIETGDPSVWVSPAITTRDGGVLRASVDLIHPSGGAFALDRSAVRITLLDGESFGVDIRGCQAG